MCSLNWNFLINNCGVFINAKRRIFWWNSFHSDYFVVAWAKGLKFDCDKFSLSPRSSIDYCYETTAVHEEEEEEWKFHLFVHSVHVFSSKKSNFILVANDPLRQAFQNNTERWKCVRENGNWIIYFLLFLLTQETFHSSSFSFSSTAPQEFIQIYLNQTAFA